MNTILVTTAYLPPIDYIKSIMDGDQTMIEQCENYQKRSYRNRAVIFTANGLLSLSIPVNKKMGNHTPIDKITIDDHDNWSHDHWQAIKSAYNKSPYFEYYSYLLEPFYQQKWETLLQLNTELLHLILKILSIQKPILATEEYFSNPTEMIDLRNLHQKHKQGETLYDIKPYPQVFDHKFAFDGKISILDLIFNLGPQAVIYLKELEIA